jgi:hypothetical protein
VNSHYVILPLKGDDESGNRKDTVMQNYPWRYLVAIAIVMFLLTIGGPVNVAAAGPETVQIVYPAQEAIVSGLVTVTGTIDFLNFMKYELFLKTSDNLVWAATVYAPVINGNLAQLDTRTYPDGFYQLIIRTVKTDSNYQEHNGPTFLIQNGLGAPQPYPEVESSPLYPPVAGALARIRNCSGNNLSFTYGSPQGFCSADDLWIPFKNQNDPLCPYVDVLLIPDCEYRGTAVGKGDDRAANYGFMAKQGKVYTFDYAGRDKLYINETKGDPRASTDTGGLDPKDPARMQSLLAETPAAGAPSQPAAGQGETAKPAAAAPTPAAPQETRPMLPVSGAGREADISFIVVAGGLILLLVIGGVIALRKRGRAA